MNFKINDGFDIRQKVILELLEGPMPGVAVIVAASNLEQILRRSIVALGISPNTAVWSKLERASGLRKYAKVWRTEVTPRHLQSLESLVGDWDNFVDSTYQLRHKLVHGAVGATTRDYAKPRVEEMLRVTKQVTEFARKCGVNLHRRLPVRRIHWVAE